VDPDARSASLDGQPLTLTPVEFGMLLCLARAADACKRASICWRKSAIAIIEAFDRSVDVHISSLRKKLGDDPKSPRFIQRFARRATC